MSKGKVKYFNDTKGWGFLSSDDIDSDIYVHYTQINMEGYKTLKEGQEVPCYSRYQLPPVYQEICPS